MEQSFSIIKTALRNVDYNFLKPVRAFLRHEDSSVEQNTDVDVKVWSANDSMLYVVDIHITISEGWEGQDDFRLELVYSVLTTVQDEEMDEKEIVQLLGTKVPREVFRKLSKLVESITLESGLQPVILSESDFPGKLPESVFRDTFEEKSEPRLGYDWILRDIQSTEEGASFLETLESYAKSLGGTCQEYDQTPLYKYYYRFLKAIDYNHPVIDDCDDDFWDILFQFVFGESDSVNVVEGANGLPEIEFTFNGYENQRISSFSPNGIKSLLSELATTAFTSTMVTLYGLECNEEYGETLNDDQPPLEPELHKLYNYDILSRSDKDIAFMRRICTRLREYEDLTFPYKLLSEYE